MRVAHPVMKMAVCAVVGATALAACSKSTTNHNVAPTIKGAFGKVPAQTGTPSMSLANDPKWTNNDKTVTITFKPWKWSDGRPVTSKDAEFFIDMTKAAVKVSPADYSQY